MKLKSRLFFVICFLGTIVITSDIKAYAKTESETYIITGVEEIPAKTETDDGNGENITDANEDTTIKTNVDSSTSMSVNVSEERDIYVMPTADLIVSEQNQRYVDRIANTDKWNDMILEIAREYGADPCFVKVIMVIESSGVVDAVAKNGCYFGLFQVGKDFKYDNKRMLEDPEYATRCGIEVMKIKADAATSNGNIPNVYEVAKRYNGSAEYAKKVSQLYEELSGGSRDDIVFNE